MYTVTGLPDDSQLLSSVLHNGVPLQLSTLPGTHAPLMLEDVLAKAAPRQHDEALTSNATSLRLSDFLRNHGLELIEVDTTIPQILPVPPIAPPTAPPEPQGEPGTLEASSEVRHRMLISRRVNHLYRISTESSFFFLSVFALHFLTSYEHIVPF